MGFGGRSSRSGRPWGCSRHHKENICSDRTAYPSLRPPVLARCRGCRRSRRPDGRCRSRLARACCTLRRAPGALPARLRRAEWGTATPDDTRETALWSARETNVPQPQRHVRVPGVIAVNAKGGRHRPEVRRTLHLAVADGRRPWPSAHCGAGPQPPPRHWYHPVGLFRRTSVQASERWPQVAFADTVAGRVMPDSVTRAVASTSPGMMPQG